MGKYMILDLETETHQGFKRKANPYMPQNYIVARGWKVQDDATCSSQFYDSADDVPQIHIPDDVITLVAHNAGFELSYERRFSPDTLHAFFKRGGKIWCTQYVQYLLEAQNPKWHMASLNDTATFYGGETKIDGVKELWEAGVLTSEIDRDLLNDYLIGEDRKGGDIGNTELIYLAQVKRVAEMAMLPAIERRMDGLCATSEMEFRGLKVDINRARGDLKKRTAELKAAEAELAQYVADLPEGLEFNWNSVYHKSAIIFGGTIKYQRRATYADERTGELARSVATARWPIIRGSATDPATLGAPSGACPETGEGTWPDQDRFLGGKRKGAAKYKNVRVPGELKMKYQDFFHRMEGFTTPSESWKSTLTDGAGDPIYGTGSDVIEKIADRGIPFLETLGEVNRLNKEIGTYYLKVEKNGTKKGMLTCVQPWDHFIHHKLNHTSTVTTRLSSSDPNMQNLTRADYDADSGTYKSEVKAMFVSRFGEDGVMAELDYSQLEVVVQGLLSGDANLIRDLNAKVDFHCKRVSLKNSVSYDFALDACKNENHPEYAKWKKERTKCKVFSFQRAYGAGAKLIAESTGMDEEEVKDLIRAEDAEYSGVVNFNINVENSINATAQPFRDPTAGYRVYRRGYYSAPTGTRYGFRSYDAKDFQRQKGIEETFSPTEMKNYPIQGTGGELVQLVLGQVWRWLVKRDFFGGRAFMVNTVHDSIYLDVHNDVRDEAIAGTKKIMEAIPQLLKHYYGIDCPVTFPVDAEIGANCLQLHHWEPGHG